MREIFITTADKDKFKNKEGNWYKGTYLHGIIQDVLGYDIFSFDRKIKLNEGVHHFTLGGADVTYFLWVNRDKKSIHKYRGYLVFSKDLKAYDFALKQYTRREEIVTI